METQLKPVNFSAGLQQIAEMTLKTSASPAKVQASAARIARSFSAARMAAKDPTAYDAVMACPEGRASLASAVIQAAELDLMPGGPYPAAWVIPQKVNGKQLVRYSISHRGVCALAARAGILVIPVAVHKEDIYRVECGEIVSHEATGDEPQTLADLAGCYVTIKKDGVVIARPWLSTSGIEARKKRSQMADRGPWVNDPVPMAMKTTILYCVARGTLVLDVPPEVNVSALDDNAVENEPDEPPAKKAPPVRRNVIDSTATEIPETTATDEGDSL